MFESSDRSTMSEYSLGIKTGQLDLNSGGFCKATCCSHSWAIFVPIKNIPSLFLSWYTDAMCSDKSFRPFGAPIYKNKKNLFINFYQIYERNRKVMWNILPTSWYWWSACLSCIKPPSHPSSELSLLSGHEVSWNTCTAKGGARAEVLTWHFLIMFLTLRYILAFNWTFSVAISPFISNESSVEINLRGAPRLVILIVGIVKCWPMHCSACIVFDSVCKYEGKDTLHSWARTTHCQAIFWIDWKWKY